MSAPLPTGVQNCYFSCAWVLRDFASVRFVIQKYGKMIFASHLTLFCFLILNLFISCPQVLKFLPQKVPPCIAFPIFEP